MTMIRRQYAPIILLGLLMFAAELATGASLLPPGGLFDPDSYMRLVRLRDALRLGAFTHVVQADNGGLGTVVYWSHLIDEIILALRLPLLPFFGGQEALRVAGALTGPLAGGALAASLVWAVMPIAERRCLALGPLLAMMSTSLFGYGLYGYVHHHLALVLAAVLCAGFAGRAAAGSVAGASWCGVAAAVGLWLSPEALPYVSMPLGAIVLAWCYRPTVGPALAAAGLAFATATLVALVADPPQGGLGSPELDCLSIVYAEFAVLCGIAACALAGTRLEAVWQRAAVAGSVLAVAIGIWLLHYPTMVQGLGGLVPAGQVQAYFGAIAEMQEVRSVRSAVHELLPGTLAVLVAGRLAWQRRDPLWAYAAACGLVVVGLAATHLRFVAYADALAALALPVALTQARCRAGRIGVLLMFLAIPALFRADASAAAVVPRCDVRGIAPALRAIPDAVVLTGIGDTPELLWRTPVRTVGSLYHRSIDAFSRARDAWRSGASASVPDTVLATGATYVLACTDRRRSILVSDLPADTLEDRLARHDVPAWLSEQARDGDYHLYRIALPQFTRAGR